MSKIDNGGAAFPIPYGQVMCDEGKGMTLRDYFAAAVLQGLSGMVIQSAATNMSSPEKTKKELAEACFGIADAMIAARKETQP